MKGGLSIVKIFRGFTRYIRDAGKSVVRNFSLSLASVSCITITLIVVAISIILSYNVENFAKTIEKDVSIIIFMNYDASSDDVSEVENLIKSTGNVESLTFKSKQDAAQEYLEGDSTFQPIIDNWTDETNPLADSFILKVKDIEYVKKTVETIKSSDKVMTVYYSENTVEQLITVFQTIERFCICAVIALVIVTAFLIANTIKLAIYSRKTEIEIMRLVGASNTSIKVPFVIEGLFLGIIGSIIPIIFTIWGYVSLYDYFGGTLLNFSLAKLVEPTPFIYMCSLLLLIIGMLVGMFGSWRAVKKYLKI
jgi:cell division transport system permease protein